MTATHCPPSDFAGARQWWESVLLAAQQSDTELAGEYRKIIAANADLVGVVFRQAWDGPFRQGDEEMSRAVAWYEADLVSRVMPPEEQIRDAERCEAISRSVALAEGVLVEGFLCSKRVLLSRNNWAHIRSARRLARAVRALGFRAHGDAFDIIEVSS